MTSILPRLRLTKDKKMKKINEQEVKIVAYEDMSFEIEGKKFQAVARDNVVMYGELKSCSTSYQPLSEVAWVLYYRLRDVGTAPSRNRWFEEEWRLIGNKFREAVCDVLRQACKDKKEVSVTFVVPGWEEEEKTVCQILNETN